MASNESFDITNNNITSDYLMYRDVVNFIYYLILIPLGFFGNLFTVIIVSYIVRHQQTRRSIPDVCLGVLASVDLSSVVLVHSISVAAESKNITKLNLGLCEYQAFVASLYLKIQFLLQILICLDRHFALVRPLQYRQFSSLKTMKFLFLLIMVVSIVSTALTYATSFRQVEVLKTWTLCHFSWDFDGLAEYLVVSITMFVICVGLIAFIICNMTLVKILWHYHKQKTELVWKEIHKAVNDLKEGKKNASLWNVENNNAPLYDAKQSKGKETQLTRHPANHNSHIEGEEKNIKDVNQTKITEKNSSGKSINQVHPNLLSTLTDKGNGFKIADDIQLTVNGNLPSMNNSISAIKKLDLDKSSNESIDPHNAAIRESKEKNKTMLKKSSTNSSPRLSVSFNANICENNESLELGESLFDDDNVFPAISITSSNENNNCKNISALDDSHLNSTSSEKQGHLKENLSCSPHGELTPQGELTNPGNDTKTGVLPLGIIAKKPESSSSLNGDKYVITVVSNCGEDITMIEDGLQSSQTVCSISNESDCLVTICNSNVRNYEAVTSETFSEDKIKENFDVRNDSIPQARSAITVDHGSPMNNAQVGQQELINISHNTDSPKSSLHLQVSLPISRYSSPQSPQGSGRMCSTTPEIVIDPPSGTSIDDNLNSTTFHQHTLTSLQSEKRYVRQKSNESSTLDHFHSQVKKVLKKIHKTAYKQQGEIFLARMVLLCAALFLLSWLPYAVVTGLYMLHQAVDPVLEDVATRCIFANAVFNPIFYGICRKNYRKGYDYITQAFCHIASFGCIQAPGDDKVFFESRKHKQKRHLEAMEYMKQERKPRKNSAVPAMQILQQTLLLRSRSLRPSETGISFSHSPARSAPADFRPSKHLQELFQRYMDESESDESEDDSSPIDYEALVCDDDQMYQNLKKVLSVYMDLNEISDDRDSHMDFDALLDLDRTEGRRLLSLSDTNTIQSDTAAVWGDDTVQLNRYLQPQLHPHDFIRQHSCPGVRMEPDETFL